MGKMRRKVYAVAGYNTISMGTGRREFNPKKERPGPEHYLKEAGGATLKMIDGAANVDDCVIGNFMAARFNRQGNLGAFFPMIDEGLRYKPAIAVEGACASGGLALISGIKSVLAETAEVALVIGFEVQNTVKAIYGADILAGAGWAAERKNGHAYYFPGKFSDRAGACFGKYGRDKMRKAMARWYANAIQNARLCPTAQEYHNTVKDLEAQGLTPPNPRGFVDNLNVFDCSKVSDAASSIAFVSEEGLKRVGIPKSEAVEIVGFAGIADNLTEGPKDPTQLLTTREAARLAFERAGITPKDLATAEIHDCFSIAGILSMEAIGFAEQGAGPDYVLEGHTARDGRIPVNTTGGLIGWGHPTGGTGVHQAVTIWEQFTGKAGDAQIPIPGDRPFGLSVNMGGDDKSLVAIVYRRAQ